MNHSSQEARPDESHSLKNADAKYLYIIVADDGGIKVGVSKNVKTRLQQIKSGKACNAKIVGTWGPFNSPLIIEADVHARLSEFAVYGEWFSCGEDAAICAAISCLSKFKDSATYTVSEIIASEDRSRKIFDSMRGEAYASRFSADEQAALVARFGADCLDKSGPELEEMMRVDIVELKDRLIEQLQNRLLHISDGLDLHEGSTSSH